MSISWVSPSLSMARSARMTSGRASHPRSSTTACAPVPACPPRLCRSVAISSSLPSAPKRARPRSTCALPRRCRRATTPRARRRTPYAPSIPILSCTWSTTLCPVRPASSWRSRPSVNARRDSPPSSWSTGQTRPRPMSTATLRSRALTHWLPAAAFRPRRHSSRQSSTSSPSSPTTLPVRYR